MRALKLSGMAKGWDTVEFKDREQYLTDLLRMEFRERKANRVNRLLKKASFRVVKTLDEFEFSKSIELPTGLTWDAVTSLAFLKAKENLILMGTVGSGKTHLATALGVKACEEGREVRFFTMAGLANALMALHRRGDFQKFLASLKKAELVILDEVDFIPLHQEAAELLFQVVDECYELRSLIITSNLELSQWGGVLGDKRLAAAMIDRLIHHTHFVVFTGESYRLAQSISRQKGGN